MEYDKNMFAQGRSRNISWSANVKPVSVGHCRCLLCVIGHSRICRISSCILVCTYGGDLGLLSGVHNPLHTIVTWSLFGYVCMGVL